MSRIGKMPISIPNGVSLEIKADSVKVKGPKGELDVKKLPNVDLGQEENVVVCTRKDESKKTRAFHGLFRKLVYNAVVGVSEGFSKTLVINGVGYRAEVKGDFLTLNLGYSNPIDYLIPDNIKITAEGNNKLTVSGINKELVGQTSAEIRSLRPPEPYKGKGIKYENETIIRKVGKAGVA